MSTITTIWELVIPSEVTELVAQAELGRATWEAVAVLEKAHMGLVTYSTYRRLTPIERSRIGGMNQTTARQRLGIGSQIGRASGSAAAILSPADLTEAILREERQRTLLLPPDVASRMVLDCDTVLYRDGTDAEIRAAAGRICFAINKRGNQ